MKTKKIELQNLAQMNWIKHWAGNWNLLNNSYLGYQYTMLLKKQLGASFKYAMFISQNGYSVAHLEFTDYKKFGNYLATKVLKDPKLVDLWCQRLVKQTDNLLGLIKILKLKKINGRDYEKFKKAFFEYGAPHRAVKIVVDALPPDKLKRYLPKFQKARLYAESVYAETENFMRFVAAQISKQVKTPAKYLLSITKEEMDQYWKSGVLPAKQELSARYKTNVILYWKGKYQLLQGKEAHRFKNAIEERTGSRGSLQGFTAYPGKVKGRVKIVFNPQTERGFEKGDILVTGMTRPEYLPLIKVAAGFITDAGGMLSHAAITARELKKPCIVGTINATKILQNDDLIEIDASKGTIERL